MAIDRAIWKEYFTEHRIPRWPCPSCRAPLRLEKGSLKSLESALSAEAQSSDDWQPDWYEGRFSGLLSCLDSRCNETVAMVGTVRTAFKDQSWATEDRYYPVCFFPALPIFSIPENVPSTVSSQIEKAFAAFWSDLNSAANRIRSAVEALLTHKRIARTPTARHKRRFLSLQQRIERFASNRPDTASTLKAVKWLGNEGSHEGKLSQEDIFDALELLEDALIKEYAKPDRRIRSLRKKINRGRGSSRQQV